MQARVIGASVSVLLHLGLAIALNLSLTPVAAPGHRSKPSSDGDDVPMRLIPSAVGADGASACQHFYTGVGMLHSHRSGRILSTVSGGPAEKAGLRAEDVILNPEILVRDGYSVGRVVVIQVLRDDVPMQFRVRIDKICFEPE